MLCVPVVHMRVHVVCDKTLSFVLYTMDASQEQDLLYTESQNLHGRH